MMRSLRLGTAQIGLDYGITNKRGAFSLSSARDLLEKALERGVTALDTAAAYGDSEAQLGRLGPLLQHFQIQTKTPLFGDLSLNISQEICADTALVEELSDSLPSFSSVVAGGGLSSKDYIWAGGGSAPVPQSWKGGLFFLDILRHGASPEQLEEVLEGALKTRPTIRQKMAAFVQEGIGRLQQAFENSESRLGAPVDSLLFHQGMDLLTPFLGRALWAAASGFKAAGRLKRLGVSVYRPLELELLGADDFFDMDIAQFPCNLLDQRFLAQPVRRFLAERNIDSQARSLFLQGILLTPFAEAARYGDLGPFLEAMHRFAHVRHLEALRLCFWPLLQWEALEGVVGASCVEEYTQIMDVVEAYFPSIARSLRKSFSPEDSRALEALACPYENLVLPPLWPWGR